MINTAIKDETRAGLAVLQHSKGKSSSRGAGLLGSFSEHLVKNLSQNLNRSVIKGTNVTTSASMSSTTRKAIRESYDHSSKKDKLDEPDKTARKRSEIDRTASKKPSASEINDEKSSRIEFESQIEHLKVIKEQIEIKLTELEAYTTTARDAQVDEKDLHNKLVNSKTILEELLARLGSISGSAFSDPLKTSSPVVGPGDENVLSYENTVPTSRHSRQGAFTGIAHSVANGAYFDETLAAPVLDLDNGVADLKTIEQNVLKSLKWLEPFTSHLDTTARTQERSDQLGTHLKGFLGLLNHHLAETLGTLSEWQYQSSLAGERSEVRIEDFLKQLEQNAMLKRESEALRYQKELATVTQQSQLHSNYGKEQFNTSTYTATSHLKQLTGTNQSFYGNQSYPGGADPQGFQNFLTGQTRPHSEFITNGSFNGNFKATPYPHISKPSSSGKSLLTETPLGAAHGGSSTGHEIKSIREFTPFTARLNPSVLLDKLVGGIKSAVRNGSEIFTLTLKPDNLGQVSVLMKKTSNQFKVRLIVSNSTVKDIIENKLADIKGQLAGENIDLKELAVEIEYRGTDGHYYDGNAKSNAHPDYSQKTHRNNARADDSVDLKTEHRTEAISILNGGDSSISLVI